MNFQNSNGYVSSSIVNYDFVPFPYEPQRTDYSQNLKQRYGEHSGILKLTITTVDRLHLGSGFSRYRAGEGIISETLAENEKLIIPGSSVKGAVRHLARAISDSCVPSEKYKVNYQGKERTEPMPIEKELQECKITVSKENNTPKRIMKICPVCNLFGMMGLASKVFFSDFTADAAGNTEVIALPQQYSPRPNSDRYYDEDGYLKGYKFYKTICEKKDYPNGEPEKLPVEVVKKGVVFTGDIRFSRLTDSELELLCQSLGIGGKFFSHKLGGYRSEGLGTVNFTCTEFRLNGEQKTPQDAEYYAKKYIDNCTDDQYDRIETIRKKIMPYREK